MSTENDTKCITFHHETRPHTPVFCPLLHVCNTSPSTIFRFCILVLTRMKSHTHMRCTDFPRVSKFTFCLCCREHVTPKWLTLIPGVTFPSFSAASGGFLARTKRRGPAVSPSSTPLAPLRSCPTGGTARLRAAKPPQKFGFNNGQLPSQAAHLVSRPQNCLISMPKIANCDKKGQTWSH